MRSLSLTRSSPAPRDRERPLGEGGGRGEGRHLVDERGDEGRVDRGSVEPRRARPRSSRRAPGRSPRDAPRSSRPSPAARRGRPCAWGRAGRRRGGPRSRAGRARPRPGRRRSRRRRAPSTSVPRRRAPPSDRGGEAVALDRHAEGREHPLGVVAARGRLADGRPSLGLQAREQHRRLHLGARDGQVVRQAAEAAAVDRQRRLAVGREHGRAHGPQGRGHPLDGPSAQGLVAREHRAERPAGEGAGEHADRRARVLRVEDGRRGAPGLEPSALDRDLGALPPDLHAEPPQAGEGGGAVRGRGVVADAGRSLGHRAQDRRPVGDGLVAGKGETAAEEGRGLDPQGREDGSTGLQCGPRRRNPCPSSA